MRIPTLLQPPLPALLAAALAWAVLAPGPAAAAEAPAGEPVAAAARGYRQIEGTVVALGSETGEGGLELVTVAVDTGEGLRQVALAPSSVLEETGFEVEPGDRLRARVAVGEGTASAQKVLNLSRDLLLRLRTFSGQPIWDAQGRWEGGEAGVAAGAAADRGRARGVRRRTVDRRPRTPDRPPP
jgi:hypothetical protein